MSSPGEDKLIESFKAWLQSEDGGSRTPRVVKKISSVVMRAARYTGSDVPNYLGLVDRSYLNGWLTDMTNAKLQPGTQRTYIGHVTNFLQFTIATEEKEFSAKKIARINAAINQWQKSLRRKDEKLRNKKELEIIKLFPTLDEIKALDTCKLTKDSIRTLKGLRDGSIPLNIATFVAARDYLIAFLTLDNTTRPGSIENMTLGEFGLAKRDKKGRWIVSVAKHKTDIDGPCHMVMTGHLYRDLHFFVNHVRKNLDGVAKEDDDTVFVSWSGEPMDGSMVSTRFSLYYARGLGKSKEDGRMNPTILRKWSTSHTHFLRPECDEQVADLQCHSEKTAKKSYLIYDKQAMAATASTNLREIMRTNLPEQDVDLQNDKLDLFEEEIDKKKVLIADVRRKLPNLPAKQQKKVCDAVRYKIGNKSARNLAKIENEDEGNESNDSEEDQDYQPGECEEYSIPKRQRRDFSKTENALVSRHLFKYTKSNIPIVKKDFKEFVEAIPELKFVYEKFGVDGLISKVRTERRGKK